MGVNHERNSVSTPLPLWEGEGGGSFPLLFGGTTEGRLAVDVCEQSGKPFYYSTKGQLQKVEMHHGVHLTGAMTADAIVDCCRNHTIGCIVDAAHPFAENLHKTIDEAHRVLGIPVVRLQRIFPDHIPDVTYCSGFDDAIAKMNEAGVKRLLALTGANTIVRLKDTQAVFRILNRPESLALAEAAGLTPDRIIIGTVFHMGIKGSGCSMVNADG